jgi:LuxR family transcriptional regulator, maltose regulon positive regulatory protein
MTHSVNPTASSDLQSPESSSAAQLAALDQGMHHRLTLLLRPAHYDELPLLQRWIHSTPWPVALLSLLPADNDPHAFLASLTNLLPETLGNSAHGAIVPHLELEEGIIEWLNAALEAPGPFAWILKDYDVITNAAIHRAVSWMLDYAPHQMHLFLTLDQEPSLPSLPRLRVRRHLLSVSLPDL